MADAAASPAKRQKQADDSAVTLYSYWRSSSSWRVRTALAIKGIKYEYKAVHLLRDGGEQLKEDYTAKNPMKEVPTLCIDGMVLNQSPAIIEYLEESRPANPLLPKDPKLRVNVRQVCCIIGCDIQPVQNLRVLKHAMSFVGEEEKTNTKLAWGKKYITAGFEALELLLARTAGKCCVGDEVTMADLFLAPQVYNAIRFGVDMSKFPIIQRVNDHLATLPAFIESDPSKQPDAES